ncbi:MAG: hypothetical protein V3U43_10610 [Pseudomonadales bacterium]
MMNWGIVITGFYAVVIVFLLLPVLLPLASGEAPELLTLEWENWWAWLLVAIFVTGQGLLLFLSVDTSRRHLEPRTHIGVSIALASVFLGFLSVMLVWSMVVVVMGDDGFPDELLWIILAPISLWVVWGGILYIYMKESSDLVTELTTWLLRGSVLELLIAVPAHVWVRHRDDCSAPSVTALGIVTGMAVMLMAFGPSVLFLLKKRLDRYRQK